MNLLRKVPIFKSVYSYKKYNANQYNLFRYSYSETKTEVKESEDLKSAGKISPEEKKKLNGPFIKNLFAGIFDVAFLEYPEYQSMEIIRDISGAVNPVEEYILNCVDSDSIDTNKKLPKEVSDYIKQQKLYGLSVPLKYGGLDLDDRCYARFSEAVGSDMSIATYLSAYNRATNAILLFGNEIQKQNNLAKIASGDLSVSFCMLEKPNVFDAFDMDTIALPDNNGEWTISGKKIWVTNGSNADKYIIFVKTWEGSIEPQDDNVLTAFLLDKNSPGITCSEPIDLLGSRAVNVCDVTFDNVKVKDEDILGEVGSGSKIAFECLSQGRLSTAASAIGYLKYVFNALIEYVNNTKISGKPMGSYEHYRKSLGVIATDLYALESMVYLTAGIKDTYTNSDLSIEESIVKVYSMEKMLEIVDKCVEIVGGNAYIKGSLFETFFRDSRSFVMHDVVPLDVTKLFLSTLGVHHAGKELQSDIKKARNPFDFPGYILKAMWKERNAMGDDVKIPELLKLELHPSLSREADLLEKCSVKFEYVIKNLLRRWGIEIVDKQLDLIRIADCVVKMYAMTAVLGRASRSYCIGFANSDYEVQVANIICNLYSNQVQHILDEVMMGPGDSGDECCCLIGDKIISQKRYFFTHPLERNY